MWLERSRIIKSVNYNITTLYYNHVHVLDFVTIVAGFSGQTQTCEIGLGGGGGRGGVILSLAMEGSGTTLDLPVNLRVVYTGR